MKDYHNEKFIISLSKSYYKKAGVAKHGQRREFGSNPTRRSEV